MMDRLRRVRTMTRDELTWRAQVFARTQAQRVGARLRSPRWDRRSLRTALADSANDTTLRHAIDTENWSAVHHALLARLQTRASRFLLDHMSADSLTVDVRARWPRAALDAASRAERLLAGRYDFLGYTDLVFAARGQAVDWHFDPVHHRRAPQAFWASVPYLNPSIGDHKIIWELNRHQHWLTFGRAWWLTSDARYRDALLAQLESWLAANPPLVGINWASMLEIGFRAMSWTWALHFLLRPAHAGAAESRVSTSADIPWLVDMLVALDRQLTHIEQNLSHYFSPNTHLTGEALALYISGLAVPELAASDRRVERGRDILLREIDRQIHSDGGHAEGSTHYHRYTLDIYLHALLAATRARDVAAIPPFTDAVTRLAEFTRSVADDRGLLPLIGDDDGGTLWPGIGRSCRDVRDSLGLAAVALARPDLAPWGVPEEVFWIAGHAASQRTRVIDANRGATACLPSRTFHESGYVVARDAHGGHAVFDVGRHGYQNAGHAHADALAMTITLANRELLIDPGTSTYVMDRRLRDRMRGSAAHNTVMIDGRPQSMPDGPFRWRTRSDATLRASRHNPSFDWAEASHDGYAPLRHRRSVLRSSSGLLVADEVLGTGRHAASAHWHFDRDWTVTVDAAGRLRATHDDGARAWLVHDADAVQLWRGDEKPGVGWCAPVYGTLMPACAARLTRQAVAPFALVTWIGTADDVASPSLERLAGMSGSIAARVIVGERVSVFLFQPGDLASGNARNASALDYQTDACVFHYTSDAHGLRELDLVDASYAKPRRDGLLTLTADAPIADLHVAIDACVLDLRATIPPGLLRLQGDALAAVQVIYLNGREWQPARVEPFGTPLAIERHRWTLDHRVRQPLSRSA